MLYLTLILDLRNLITMNNLSFPLFRRLAMLITLIAVAITLPTQAQEQYLEGEDYHALEEAQPVEVPDKIEVTYLFWYGSQNSYALEPLILDFAENRTPDYVNFRTEPAVIDQGWDFHAQTYHTFDAMGLTNSLHNSFYETIHGDNDYEITDFDSLLEWVQDQGQNGEAFEQTFESSTVEEMVYQSRQLVHNYELGEVPTIVVDGKYRTTLSDAGSLERFFDVIEYLIEISAQERNNT